MITKKQKQVYDYICGFQKARGYPPSLDDICKEFGLASVSTAHFHVSKLRDAGYLSREEKRPCVVNAVDPGDIVKAPILGTIAAGQPLEAVAVPDESIALVKSEIGEPGEYYALRVEGDSMIEDGILDGDIVVIRSQDTAHDGQTVVAIVDDNAATIKRVYGDKKSVQLHPANQAMLPSFRDEVEIRGVVVKVIRNVKGSAPGGIQRVRQDITLAYKKKRLLERIRSSAKGVDNRYTRVALSPIRYAGGKSLAVGYVVELLPDNIRRVVSPFFGGGSVEIAIDKHLGLEVVGYDVFDILCNYWKFQIENPTLLHQELSTLRPDKSTFERIRLILNDVWKGNVKLDPLTLAVYFVYNFNLSYGPGFMGWSSHIYLNEDRYKNMLDRIRDFRVQKLRVECGDFREVISNYPNDFLYCDPPYYIGDDSKMFRGIYPMRNIPVHHRGFPHEVLRDMLRNHKGGFVLSYNNCPTIREYYQEFEQFFPRWQYTMGQGETRIGKNRIDKGQNHVKQSHEILVFSPPTI